MKKRFTILIAAAFMLLTMMASTGTMWGQTRDVQELTNANIVAAGNPESGYRDWTITDSNDNEWQAYAIKNKHSNATSAYHFLQIKKYASNTAYYIQVPELGTKITSITMTVSSTNQPMTGGNNTATLYFSNNNSTSSSGSGVASGTGASSVTIDCSSLDLNTGYITSSGAVRIWDISVTYTSGGGSTPSITADDVNIAYNATEGSIAYTINNSVEGGALTASTTSEWLTPGTVTASTVPFTCSANEGAERAATVTLTYTYNDTETVTKDVTITQAAAPNNISDITDVSTPYTVIGTVVATNSKGFVIGDGTGYVYTYLGSAPSQAVNDKVKIAGTTGTYGQILQFTSNASITTSQTSNYDGTPAVTVINAVPDYSTGLHLSTYLQFEGELEKSSSNYYITVGSDQIQISYPTTAQSTALIALDGKNVRVKGYFSGNNSSGYFSVMMESVEEVTNPTLAVDPATAQAFTYIAGNGPSDDQMFTVTGTNLVSSDITAAVSSDYEITDNTDYSNSVTIASGDIVSVRLKAGLAKGTHNGTLTLSSIDAEDVVVNLSGTVTGQAYTINLDDQVVGGTIEADLASAEEGTTVTLTAHPEAAYTFGSWTVYKDDLSTEVTVTDNQFTMPACEVYVTATFNAKPTYAITCVADPVAGGTIVSDENAYEGKTVTISCEAASGYSLSSIIITKTSDSSATGITPTVSGDDFTFTMPAYDVTVTATFLSNTYEGSFALFSGALTEGDYILVYNNQAMNDTLNNSKYKVTSVSAVNNIISDPSRAIVWHIAPSKTTGYWTISSAATNNYVSGTASSTNVAAVNDTTTSANTNWKVSGTYDFRCKANEGQSTARYLRNNNGVFGNYASSNGGALTLYKMTTLTERTITFNGNGGTYNDETTYTQKVYDGIAANLTANQFTKANAEFAGWALTADGDVVYADQAEVTINDDLGLYAKWSTLYTLTVDNNIDGGSVSIVGSITSAVEGTEITLSYSPTTGHAFSAWNVYKTGDSETIVTVTDNKFNMPAYNVTVSATFVEAKTYSLVTNVSQIVSGKHYIIASGTNGSVKVMAGQNDNNRTSVAVTATNGVIPETSGIYEFVINGPFTYDEKDCYTIYDTNVNSTGFLYAASSSSNYLRTKSGLDNNGKWTIEIATTGSEANIKAQGSNTRNWMRNNGSLFSCYGSGSSQADIYLFVKDNDKDYEFYGSEISYTEISIPADETITVGTGSVMTITSNSFTNNNPDNLIIEDGGQIIHDNAGVKATVKKSITGYGTGTGNYYLLVTPFTENIDPASVTNMIAATPTDYDLYQWNSGEAEEWRNYKQGTFTLNNGIGYLYANKNNVELTFTGTLKQSNEVVTVNPDYITADFGDWTLVGNPFPCDAYIIDANSSMAFYRMKSAGNGFETATGAIKPMEGIFVQTSEESQSFKFTREAPVTSPGKGNLNINVAQVVNSRDAQPVADNAIIRFDGGNNLKKFSFREDNTKVYIPQNGKDYAVVNAQAQGEMPVNFKAAENGTYTIDFSMDNVEFSYLHLIDNKTGMDIDLLQTSSYTFEASKIDYASRFKLVFSTNSNSNSNDDNSFAFFDANGNLMILGIDGTATLQRHQQRDLQRQL